jgi:hypothetical protein
MPIISIAKLAATTLIVPITATLLKLTTLAIPIIATPFKYNTCKAIRGRVASNIS